MARPRTAASRAPRLRRRAPWTSPRRAPRGSAGGDAGVWVGQWSGTLAPIAGISMRAGHAAPPLEAERGYLAICRATAVRDVLGAAEGTDRVNPASCVRAISP